MALKNTNTVDVVAPPLDGRPRGLDLIVVDSAAVTDELERYCLLVEKLGSYVGYVTDAEFTSIHPGIRSADVIIRVLCKTHPKRQ
ncbi:MAG: hypothetical protein C4321_08205 [Chloroflexota bacterium]